MQIQSNPAAHAAASKNQSSKSQPKAQASDKGFSSKLNEAKASKNAAASEGQKSSGKPNLSGSEMAELKQKLAARGAKV